MKDPRKKIILGYRDAAFIDSRLAAPAVAVGEAVKRLRDLGFAAEADELMAALQTFTDACRQIRRVVLW